ncbi:MAG: DUF2147 domain-containing protein [Sphingobium sp.]
MKAKLFLLALLLAPATAHAQSETGDWLTDDGSAIVHVAPCGEKLCGRIAKVLDPKAPTNDACNPDPARRSRPLVGVAVLSDFQRAGAGWDNGSAYDPKAGRSYKSRLALDGPDRLAVTGCILFLCRTRHWKRLP